MTAGALFKVLRISRLRRTVSNHQANPKKYAMILFLLNYLEIATRVKYSEKEKNSKIDHYFKK